MSSLVYAAVCISFRSEVWYLMFSNAFDGRGLKFETCSVPQHVKLFDSFTAVTQEGLLSWNPCQACNRGGHRLLHVDRQRD